MQKWGNSFLGMSLIACLALVSGCVATPSAAPPTQLPALDVTAAQRNWVATGARGVDILDQRNDGFRVFFDGKVEFYGPKRLSSDSVDTRVTRIEGNKLCVAAVDSWSGACLEFFGDAGPDVHVVVTYGNGYDWTYQSTIVPVP